MEMLGSPAFRKLLVTAAGMLLTGSVTTLSMAAADREGFDHPFIQAWFMFLGEILCLCALFPDESHSAHADPDGPVVLAHLLPW